MGSRGSKQQKPQENSVNPDGNNNRDNNRNEKKKRKIANQGSGPYQMYTEFPDIQRIRASQLDYRKSTYEIDDDEDGVPHPFPPIISRQQLYDKYNFTRIDSRAENAPSKLSRDTGQLVTYLCQNARDDVEKVRAIFAWISSRDRINTAPELGSGFPPNGSPLEHLSMIMSNASTYTYNTLFESLCKEAKIPCKQVLGKIRASARELGDTPSSSGTYYMVFVEGNWHFVHPHWGSCYVRSVTTRDEWRLVEGVSGQKSGLSSVVSPNLLAFEREDFWFFVDPEVMAHFFLSLNNEHQLLARPIDLPEYQAMARLYQPFFQKQFTSISPSQCKLDDVHETITFEIGLPDQIKMVFDYGIYKRALDPEWKLSTDFRRMVTMERTGKKLKATFNMPHIGVYKFELNAHDSFDEDSRLTLCEYFIDNKTPNFACRPNPPNSLNEWGAGHKAQQVGLEPEQEGGQIEAKEGQAVVKFRLKVTDKKNLKFNYKLEDDKGKTEDLKDFVRHSNQEDKSNVIIRTPHHGKYVLKVQAKDDMDKEYHDVCNYLVTSDRGVADDTPFPKAPNGQIGVLEKKDKVLMEAISHKDPIIDVNENGRVEITMKEHEDLEVLPKLTMNNEDKSDYVYHYKVNNSERVYILLLPYAGWFSFKILARKKGTNSDHSTAYQYVVINQKPKPDCVPFPRIMSGWQDNFVIIKPRDGQLPNHKPQRFRFKIPGAESVTLVRGEEEIKLNKVSLKHLIDDIKSDGKQAGDKSDVKDDKNVDKKGVRSGSTADIGDEDIWEAEMDTGQGGSEVKVVVKQKGSNNTDDLVCYKILSDVDDEMAQKAQKAAEEEAERKIENKKKRADAEAKQADNRQKKMEKKVKAQQDDYAKNKDKYLANQRRLEEAAVKKEKGIFDMKEFQGRTEKKRTPYKEQQESIRQRRLADAESKREQAEKEETKRINAEHEVMKKISDEMADTSGWKELQLKITKEMRLEKLREAIRARDRDRLETAIDEASNSGVPQDEELLIKADKELEVLIVRDELRESMQKRDAAALKASIQKIYDNNLYYSRLQQDVAEAIQVLERLQRMIELKVDHLEMNAALFSELRRYNKPPVIVHRVMQATLLLFEEDEDRTESWRVCQQHLNPSGTHSMTRKILDFDASNVNEEVAARTRQILEEYEIQKVQEVSPAASTFYAWSMGAVDSIVPEGSKVKPASVRRQCQIFGRPMESPKRNYDFRFSMRKSKTNSIVNSPEPNE